MVRLFALAFALLFMQTVAQTASAETFTVPMLTSPVVDDAGLLQPQTRQALEGAIRKLRDQGGSQLNVLTVSSLGGLEIEQASIQVTDAWKLGGAKTDNGALLLIAPNERKVRIEVGQGLEGQLTDAYSKRIIEDVILPRFKAQRFDEGVILGVASIIEKTDPNVDVQSLFGESMQRRKGESSGRGGSRSFYFFLGFIILIMLLSGGGRGGRRRRGSFSPWGAAALGYGLGGLGGRSGGFGGGGGGGWGGGGGGFSGGGASGGW